jgi:hypothetical protein
MATRVGFELSPRRCRIVEIETTPAGVSVETRVRAFASLAMPGADALAAIDSLRGRRAAVVVWNALGDHRAVDVAAGSYEDMRAGALAQAARESGGRIDRRGVLADIAPGPAHETSSSTRRKLILASADAAAVRAALRPLVEAGVRIDAIATPASALLSLARIRRAHPTSLTAGAPSPDAIDAYVALDESATAVALVRNGSLAGARELPWGFLERDGRRLRPRLDVAAMLGNELATLFSRASGPVHQVCVCGGLPDLRSTMMPLMERLEIEVDTLDSLFGIDAESLPEPANDFRERASELRMAWAVGADAAAPLNLMRPSRRASIRRWSSRAAVIAGLAVGLGAAWAFEARQQAQTPVVKVVPSGVLLRDGDGRTKQLLLPGASALAEKQTRGGVLSQLSHNE